MLPIFEHLLKILDDRIFNTTVSQFASVNEANAARGALLQIKHELEQEMLNSSLNELLACAKIAYEKLEYSSSGSYSTNDAFLERFRKSLESK